MVFPVDPRQFRHRLKLRQILLLDALANGASLRQAAGRIFLTQPAATKCLSELEDALGVQLFERSTRGLVPTIYGEAMTRHAQRLLADIDTAHVDIQELHSGSQGTVRIGTLVPLTIDVLPSIVADVKCRYPRMHIRIDQVAQEELVAKLRGGAYDVAYARALPEHELGTLRQIQLYEEGFHVVTGPDSPITPDRLVLADTLDAAWVLPPEGPLRKRIDAIFHSVCGRVPANVVESNSLSFKLGYIRSAGHFGFLSKGFANYYADLGVISSLSELVPDFLGPHSLLWRSDNFHGPAVEHIIQCTQRLMQTGTVRGLVGHAA